MAGLWIFAVRMNMRSVCTTEAAQTFVEKKKTSDIEMLFPDIGTLMWVKCRIVHTKLSLFPEAMKSSLVNGVK